MSLWPVMTLIPPLIPASGKQFLVAQQALPSTVQMAMPLIVDDVYETGYFKIF